MLNVTVKSSAVCNFEGKGCWFDFEEGRIIFRNIENKPLFEIICNRKNYSKILLTSEEVLYAEVINIDYKVDNNDSYCVIYCINENNKLKKVLVKI